MDIGSACLEIGRGTISLLCLKDPSMRIHPWTFLVCQMFGVLCYVTSTYFIVALTVVKTINIMRPFYSMNNRVLKIVLFIYPSILLVMCIIDIWDWNDTITTGHDDYPKCGVGEGPLLIMTLLETIGSGTTSLALSLMVRYFALSYGGSSSYVVYHGDSCAFSSVCSAFLDRVCMHGSSDDLYKKSFWKS